MESTEKQVRLLRLAPASLQPLPLAPALSGTGEQRSAQLYPHSMSHTHLPPRAHV